ncbi:LisH domain-containing protein C16orf63 [Danaus plexippus plexippus]|nr:LisH domain-containing protein C16orf63 [Danaus plexippus plexippus]
MRAKVTEVLQERQVLNPGFKSAGIPKPSDEVLLINELVKEYLEWNGYLYTASVMGSEAAMPNVRKTRAELCSEVGVKDDEKSSALPLLSNIIAAYTERIKRKISKIKRDH